MEKNKEDITTEKILQSGKFPAIITEADIVGLENATTLFRLDKINAITLIERTENKSRYLLDLVIVYMDGSEALRFEFPFDSPKNSAKEFYEYVTKRL